MTDPRTPETREAQLPDPLDQVPDAHPGEGLFGEHGSEDAALLAGAAQAEGDVEQPAPDGEPEPPAS
ncbi:MAG: hypothetical protein JO276_02265 [Sphingomonadaceae bacterium]|nr:hypothetical protein [Sphingomonadaceae bacterium]